MWIINSYNCCKPHCKLNKLAFGFLHRPLWTWCSLDNSLGPNHLWDTKKADFWVLSGVHTPCGPPGLSGAHQPLLGPSNFCMCLLALELCLSTQSFILHHVSNALSSLICEHIHHMCHFNQLKRQLFALFHIHTLMHVLALCSKNLANKL